MRALAQHCARRTATIILLMPLGSCEPAPAPESRPAFEDYTVREVPLGMPEAEEVVRAAYIGPDFFPAFPEAVLVQGRSLMADDFQPDAPAAAVLGHAFWVSRFSSDPAVLGRFILLNGVEHVVVGLIGEGAVGPEGAMLYVPGEPRTPDPPRSGMSEEEAERELRWCFGHPDLPDVHPMQEVRTGGSEGFHLIRYDVDPSEDGIEYVVAIELPTDDCRVQALTLRSRSDDFYYPLGLSATGVPVLQSLWDGGGTDAPPEPETYLLSDDGELEEAGPGLEFLPGRAFLYSRRQILDPQTGESLSLDALGNGQILASFPLSRGSVLLTRCEERLCNGYVDDTEPQGWAQVVTWGQGVRAEFPFRGFAPNLIDSYVLVRQVEGFTVLLDHRAELLTVVPHLDPGAFVQYPLAGLPAMSAEESNEAITLSYPAQEGGSDSVHYLLFTSPGEPPLYRFAIHSWR